MNEVRHCATILMIAAAPGAVVEPEPFLWVLPRVPPPWMLYVTALLALLAFILTVEKMVRERRERRKTRGLSVDDEFWFRRMIVPVCMEPIISFFFEQSASLDAVMTRPASAVTRQEFEKFLRQFKKAKVDMAHRSRILCAVSTETYKRVVAELDELDDRVTDLCARCSLPEEFGSQARAGRDTGDQARFFESLAIIVSVLKSYQSKM